MKVVQHQKSGSTSKRTRNPTMAVLDREKRNAINRDRYKEIKEKRNARRRELYRFRSSVMRAHIEVECLGLFCNIPLYLAFYPSYYFIFHMLSKA